jgi:uncharacterized protein (TIGR02996 family)
MKTRPDSDEAAFLAAIIAAPEDDTVRLAYADWLDERGHPARAGYIRRRILGFSALGVRGTTSDLIVELGRLEDESLGAFCAWAGPELAPYFRDKSRYERGLLHSVAAGPRGNRRPSVPDLTGHCERLFRLAPVRDVHLWGGTPEEIRALLFRPEMARVETLGVGYWCWLEDAERVVDALIDSPHLGGLKSLVVHSAADPDERDEDEPADRLSGAQRARLAERFAGVLA